MAGHSTSLTDKWDAHAKPLFALNGTAHKFAHGGHDIAGNPALAATLREIGHGYLPKCEYKIFLLKRNREIDQLLMSSDSDVAVNTLIDEGEEIKKNIEKFDVELIHQNASSIKRIMNSDGFKQELRRRGEEGDREQARALATNMLAPLIRFGVAAAAEHCNYIATYKDDPRIISALKGVVPLQTNEEGCTR